MGAQNVDESSESSCEIPLIIPKKQIALSQSTLPHKTGEEESITYNTDKEESMTHDADKQASMPNDTETEESAKVLVSVVHKKCDGSRLYDKKQHCIFCRKSFSKISRTAALE